MEPQEQPLEEEDFFGTEAERQYAARVERERRKRLLARVPRYLEYKKALTAQNESRQELVTRIMQCLPCELQARILKFLAEALLPTTATFRDFEKISDFRMPEHIREGSTMSRMAQVVLETLGQVRLDRSRSCCDTTRYPKQDDFGMYKRAKEASSPYRIEGIERLTAHFGSHAHEAILDRVALVSPTPWVSRQTSSLPPYPSHLDGLAKHIREMHWDLEIPCNTRTTYSSAFYTTLSNVEKLKEWLPGLREFRLAIIEKKSYRSIALYFARGWSQKLITIHDLLDMAVVEMRKSSINIRSLCFCESEKTETYWAKPETQQAIDMKGESEVTIADMLVSQPGQVFEF